MHTIPPTTNPQKLSRRFLLWWVIANTIAVDIAIIGAYLLLLGLAFSEGHFEGPELFIFVTPPALIIGIGQWLVIRPYIARSALWVLASAVGATLTPAIAPIIVANANLNVDAGAVYFLVLLPAIAQIIAGILQGLLLASQLPKFSWSEWLGALVGGIIVVGLLTLFLTSDELYASGFSIVCIPFLFLCGSPFGFTTGSVLKNIL